MSPLAGVGKILDQFRRGGEERLEAVLDSTVPDGHRQMGLPSAGLPVQDQRSALGDEVQSEIGADHGFPESGLQSEVELVDGLEEFSEPTSCTKRGYAPVILTLSLAYQQPKS